jgi:L-seryl-tRNA(Ser) seleniumtransferase
LKASIQSGLYRKLPSVDELLRSPELSPLISRDGHAAVTDAARIVLARLRGAIADGQLRAENLDLAISGLANAIARQLLESLSYSLQPVINATGVILHTNLGRAPLTTAAFEHIQQTSSAYSNLEFDLSTGERGHRDVHADRLFRQLFDQDIHVAENHRPAQNDAAISTIIVNNNAAAVLLALNTLADGGEAIVSRGELVEIGGSFRIPEVMAKSGAILREVGSTNRTRISDYEHAIHERTRLLLRVHRSNFQITGFTEQPTLAELAELSRRRNIPLMEDLGSGALFDLRNVGINGEPTVHESLRAGVDIVTYSGDKLLGGPQAGLLSGRSNLIARMRSNSLFRALRVDKFTYAALEATLLAYLKNDIDAIPAIRMMRLSAEEIGKRATAIVARISSTKLKADVITGESVIGGGAAPSAALPTRLIALTHQDFSTDELYAKLRSNNPPIIARVEEGRVLLDLRTVFPEQDKAIADCLLNIFN